MSQIMLPASRLQEVDTSVVSTSKVFITRISLSTFYILIFTWDILLGIYPVRTITLLTISAKRGNVSRPTGVECWAKSSVSRVINTNYRLPSSLLLASSERGGAQFELCLSDLTSKSKWDIFLNISTALPPYVPHVEGKIQKQNQKLLSMFPVELTNGRAAKKIRSCAYTFTLCSRFQLIVQLDIRDYTTKF